MDIWLGGDSLDNVMEFVNLVNSDFSCVLVSHMFKTKLPNNLQSFDLLATH